MVNRLFRAHFFHENGARSYEFIEFQRVLNKKIGCIMSFGIFFIKRRREVDDIRLMMVSSCIDYFSLREAIRTLS